MRCVVWALVRVSRGCAGPVLALGAVALARWLHRPVPASGWSHSFSEAFQGRSPARSQLGRLSTLLAFPLEAEAAGSGRAAREPEIGHWCQGYTGTLVKSLWPRADQQGASPRGPTHRTAFHSRSPPLTLPAARARGLWHHLLRFTASGHPGAVACGLLASASTSPRQLSVGLSFRVSVPVFCPEPRGARVCAVSSPWSTEQELLDLCVDRASADRPSPRVRLRGFAQGLRVANSGLKGQ